MGSLAGPKPHDFLAGLSGVTKYNPLEEEKHGGEAKPSICTPVIAVDEELDVEGLGRRLVAIAFLSTAEGSHGSMQELTRQL